ncbi:MAG: recombinase family protein [Candidatus Thermoplasmatota archaeon]
MSTGRTGETFRMDESGNTAKDDRRLKVALYARVSTADGQTNENQLIRLREYAHARGWDVYSTYQDVASGADPNRPNLKRMMNDARARRFGLVLTTKIDRIARSSLNLKQIIGELEERGIKFECSDQPFSTNTPTGRLLVGILGEIAEFERALIVERTKAGLERVKSEGRSLGRPRKAIDMALARELRSQGLGYRKIAKRFGVSYVTARARLNKEGVEAPSELVGEPKA